jgi:2-phospho-L-lactate/phosphoenolpyruvate guanylyltransferase
MRTIAILPIKSFGAAKQRLAGQLGNGSRRALAQAMFCDVLNSLRHVPQLDAVAVVTGDRAAESAAWGGGVLVLRDVAEAGQSAAAAIGIRHAVQAGFERVLLVPGDAPLLDPCELGALLERSEAQGVAVTIVPDRHGAGTNALLLAPPEAIEPSFGPGSLERHVVAVDTAGIRHAVEALPSLELDIDTPEDLAELSTILAERRGHAPMTRGTLRQLDRLRGPVPSAVQPPAEPPAVRAA